MDWKVTDSASSRRLNRDVSAEQNAAETRPSGISGVIAAMMKRCSSVA
jgi:hypothetical protein